MRRIEEFKIVMKLFFLLHRCLKYIIHFVESYITTWRSRSHEAIRARGWVGDRATTTEVNVPQHSQIYPMGKKYRLSTLESLNWDQKMKQLGDLCTGGEKPVLSKLYGNYLQWTATCNGLAIMSASFLYKNDIEDPYKYQETRDFIDVATEVFTKLPSEPRIGQQAII